MSRLARSKDFEENGIDQSSILPISDPRFKNIQKEDSDAITTWHDTIPLPAAGCVFVVMNFDAQEKVGRFVFNCHILDHEDNGLMAPIQEFN